jgi:hypothetical protein
MFPMHTYDLMKARLAEANRRAEHAGLHAHDLRRAQRRRTPR